MVILLAFMLELLGSATAQLPAIGLLCYGIPVLAMTFMHISPLPAVHAALQDELKGTGTMSSRQGADELSRGGQRWIEQGPACIIPRTDSYRRNTNKLFSSPGGRKMICVCWLCAYRMNSRAKTAKVRGAPCQKH